MSTSFLYHSSKVQGVIYEKTIYEKDRIIFRVKPKESLFVCSKCESTHVVRNGGSERLIRNLKIGRKTTFIQIYQSRLRCKDCHSSCMMELPFVEKWKNYTRAVALEAWDLSRAMTLKDVADYLGMDWRAVKDIQKEKLKTKYERPSLKNLENIGIDEICIGKGHKYITVVIDLDSGRVIYMEKGKNSSSLNPFWKRLRRSKARVKAVAIDMSPAYISAVKYHLPDATIVFDHFHVIKLFNEKLSAFRRALYHHLPDSEKKDVLKGSRWLLLKNPENLTEKHDEHNRLERALELNSSLSKVCYMKEELRQIWRQDSKKEARKMLNLWVKQAEESKVPMLRKFAYRLLAYRNSILSYYDNKLSSGPVEAFNNKIKTIQRQAYGYRDQEFFRLKVFSSHEAKFKLVG